MNFRYIIYFFFITLIYAIISVVTSHVLFEVDFATSIAYILLILLEILLLCQLVGAKNVLKVYSIHPLFYLATTIAIAAILTFNVIGFVDTLFKNTLHISPHLFIFYLTITILNVIFLNTIGNYLLFKIKNEKISDQDSFLSQSEQLKKEAELYKLRQQVDPHFLFNSLNSIQALLHINQEKATEMIFSLSQYFRNSIQKQDQNFITLQDEIIDIRLYLSIEMVRFGHRLHVKEEIDEKVLDTNIPPLILQPLIENAIKYGVYGTSGNVTIHLDIKRKSLPNSHNYVQCIISNPYDENTQINSGTGFGIAGIMRRLYLTYNRNDLIHIIRTKENETSIFKVILNIPYPS